MAHLAAGRRDILAVKMQMRALLLDEARPFLRSGTDEIFHLDPRREPSRRAERPTADRPHMLGELRGLGALDRPMPRVVDARRDLVHEKRFTPLRLANEHLDREDADYLQGLRRAPRDLDGLLHRARVPPRRDGGARQDMVAMLVLAKVVCRERAVGPARRDDRDLAPEGDEAFKDRGSFPDRMPG